MSRLEIPEGFSIYPENSPFIDLLGPLYVRMEGRQPILGMRIAEYHCNNKGTAHGGLMATLADLSLGKTAGWSVEPRIPLLTASLTIDYLSAARLGDWVEAVTDFHRVGKDLAFGNCFISSGDKHLVRANGVYKVIDPS